MKYNPSDSLPPRTKYRFNEKLKEYQVKRKFRWKDVDGKLKDSETPWLNSFEELTEFIEKKRASSLSGLDEKNQSKTFGRYFNDYIHYCQDLGTGKNANSSYLHKYKSSHQLEPRLSDELRNIKLSQLKETDFSKYITKLNEQAERTKKISGQTMRKYRNTLHQFVDYLYSQGYIDYIKKYSFDIGIKTTKIIPKEYNKRQDRNTPKIEDLNKLTDYIKSLEGGLAPFENLYWYTILKVLFFSGMRVGEVIALRWEDIDFEDANGNGVIHIRDSICETDTLEQINNRYNNKQRNTKTYSSRRDLTMLASYSDLMKTYKEAYSYHYHLSECNMEREFVFPNVTARSQKDRLNHQRHDNILENINRLCKKAKVNKFDSQMLRHASARFYLIDNGVPREAMSKYLGHADSRMINIHYANFKPEDSRREVDPFFSGMMSNNPVGDNERSHKKVVEEYSNPSLVAEKAKQAKIALFKEQVKKKKEKGELGFMVNENDMQIAKELIANHDKDISGIVFLNDELREDFKK